MAPIRLREGDSLPANCLLDCTWMCKSNRRRGFGFHSKTSCFLLSARLRSLSATSCRLLLALLSLNDETRRSPHSLLETMRVCPANSQRLKTWKFLSRTFRIPSKEPNDCHGWHPFGYGKERQFASKLSVRFAHGCANLTTGKKGIRLPLENVLFSPFSPPTLTFGDVLSPPPRLALAK